MIRLVFDVLYLCLQEADLSRDQATHCSICNKHFSSRNAFDNHIKSKKHKEAESKSQRGTQSAGKLSADENARVAQKNKQNELIKQGLDSKNTGSASDSAAGKDVLEDMDDDGKNNMGRANVKYIIIFTWKRNPQANINTLY